MTARPLASQLLGLAGWALACFASAALGSIASIQAPAFYGRLAQPSWSPPAWVFGPVWTVLFVMMAAAAWLVWREGPTPATRRALALFVAQLVANALWSWLFFRWNLGGLAFAEVLVLWALIAATLVAFWRVRPLAGALLLPYLAWVSFASVLNFVLWRANPGLL